jgi:sugar phosphate isomerase/epimerase
MAKPIALQLYTVRDALAQDWIGTLEQIAEAGYLGVETAGFSYAPSLEVAAAKFNELGLEVVSAHAPLPTGQAGDPAIEMMAALDCKRLICAGTGSDKFGNLADVRERASVFNAANAIARAHGLEFGLHNHYWEFNKIGDRYAYDILLDMLDDDIMLEVDIYWVQTSGVNAVDYLKRMAARVPLLHIKDGPCTIDGDMVAVGTGSMDIVGCIAAGTAAEWLIVELDRCATDMLTAVIESANFLTRNGLGRGR